MIALSIRQPWAWLIIRPDITDPQERRLSIGHGLLKDIENRTWPTNVRGDILVHAGKGMTGEEYETCAAAAHWIAGIKLPPPAALQRGGIVGQVRIAGCSRPCESKWWNGEGYGFELRDPMPLPFTPCLGQLSFFDVPYSAIATTGDAGQAGPAAQGGLF